jgi:hypothetical protein
MPERSTPKPETQDFEIRRNNPIAQPALWTSHFCHVALSIAPKMPRATGLDEKSPFGSRLCPKPALGDLSISHE